MNSCVLMAEIVSEPQLRSTQDNLDVAEMIVRFDGLREEDPPATIKVLGWGNLASDIKNHYNQGDRIIIEGRLSMNTIEMQEGYKEKRAELVASRIFALGENMTPASNISASTTRQDNDYAAATVSSTPASMSQIPQETPSFTHSSAPKPQESPVLNDPAPSSDDGNWDEIPF